MRNLALTASFLLLAISSPIAAATFDLSFNGSAEYEPGLGYYEISYNENGSGKLSLDATKSAISLSDGLSGFSFTTTLYETATGTDGTYNFPSTSATYNIGDLAFFDAILSGGIVTSYEFGTNPKFLHYGDGDAVSFYAYYDSGSGYAGSDIDGFGPSTSGSLALTAGAAAVPEPSTWALVIGGFGLLAPSLRKRRRIATLD